MMQTEAMGRILARVSKLGGLILLTSTLSGCLWDPWGWQGNAAGSPSPGNLAPQFTSPGSITIAEGSPSNVYTATAVDGDNDPLIFSLIGGADQASFNIDANTGALSFNTPADFENPSDNDADNEYVVEMLVDDGKDGFDSLTLTVIVTNANDAPLFTSGNTITIAENSGANYRATAFDQDFDALSFSLSGGPDQALFTIDSVTGVLSFNSPPDFENPADSDADNDYVVQLRVDDGNGGFGLLALVISVTNGNEIPQFTSGNSVVIPENSTTSYTATAVDADLDVLSFSISGGADQALFNIDSVSGVLSFNTPPDFEIPADADNNNEYIVELRVDDGNGGFDLLTLTVSVTNVNEAPLFTSGSAIDIPENSATSYTATAVDPELDALSFSISGGPDQALFNIDSVSGVLSFNAPPDFESPADADSDNIYVVDLRVDDGSGGFDLLTLTVSVTNVNEAPLFTSGSAIDIPENSTTSYTATAVDPELDALSFSISGGPDQALFNIDSVSGVLGFNSPPDFESPADADNDNVYIVDITADDGNGESAVLTVSFTVLDVSQLEVRASFPTPYSNLGGISVTTITGNLMDLEDGIVDFDDVNFVDVNGQMALLSMSNPGRWSLQIPAAAPNDTFVILADSVNGGTDSTSVTVENNALILIPDLVVMDASNDRILVGDSGGFGAVVSIDLADGRRSVIADANTGSGTPIAFPDAAVLDESNNRVLVIDSTLDALISLDLASGDRILISDSGTGTGPSFSNPLSITLDEANNTALVTDADLEALMAVDLATGNRSIVSDAGRGIGPTLFFPTAVVYDAANGRALVADVVQEALIAVDIATGDRTVVADVSTGAGLNFPISMVLDPPANRVLVGDINVEALLSIDLASGAGTVISDASTGSGPALTFPRSLAFDAVRDETLVVDSNLGEILAVDMATGDRAVFAENTTGAGPTLLGASAVALHSASERVLSTVVNENGAGLVWVDLATADRTTLAGTGTGTGPDLDAPTGMVLDVANNAALVLDDTLDALLSVDLANGNRTLLSDLSTGSGAAFGTPNSLALDSPNNRVLVVDDALDALLSVDLANGDRVIVSDAGAGGGPLITSPTSVALDSAGNRALLLDTDLDAMISVDLATGNRTVIADAGIGSGPALVDPLSIALDLVNNRALVADGLFPATLNWVDLASGDRSVVSDLAGTGPILVSIPSVVLDAANDRAFAVDTEIAGLIVVELGTGQRAVASQ